MPVREGPPQPAPPPKDYPAEKARQGRIILRTRTQRLIFISGLAGAVLLGLLLTFAGAFGA
ncbi:MAG: peptide ABC transporter permease [Hyphomicrobiaceae bacterium]|nr:peptide ABC transporter permease [Hyphomicrobiaceae bacterium]